MEKVSIISPEQIHEILEKEKLYYEPGTTVDILLKAQQDSIKQVIESQFKDDEGNIHITKGDWDFIWGG